MAEKTEIAWCDSTLPDEGIAPKRGLVSEAMASHAEGHTITNVKPEVGMFGKWTDMVGVQVAARVIPAMTAGKPIPVEYVISPALQIGRKSRTSALQAFPIDIARSVFTARRALASYGANFGACFQRMLLANPIARSRLGCCAHLGAACGRHLFTLPHLSII